MVACAFRRRSLEADDLGIWLTPQAKSRIEPASIEGYMTMGDAIRKKLNSIREPKPVIREINAQELISKISCGLEESQQVISDKTNDSPYYSNHIQFFLFHFAFSSFNIYSEILYQSIHSTCLEKFFPKSSCILRKLAGINYPFSDFA